MEEGNALGCPLGYGPYGLIGQKDDEEQQAESDEENYHDSFEAEQTTQSFFLAYHEVKAHL